jgi:DNA-3-methyladenine glycosylase
MTRATDMPPVRSSKLGADFYRQPAVHLASALLGTIMVRKVEGVLRRARLVEVEAYCGPRDLASHSSKGRTARTEVMFGPAGRAYVYFIYGMYWMFNITAGVTGEAEAVLIRAAEPLDDWEADLSGPAKLARAFAITRKDNAMDLTGHDIHLIAAAGYRPKIIRRKRVGVDYAGHWTRRLLRFIDAKSPVARRLRA